MGKRKIAVFDFDGTITSKDSFMEFIKFAKGKTAFYAGLFIFSPLLIAMKMGFISNTVAKKLFFSYFFKGMNINTFKRYCNGFSKKIQLIVRPAAICKINELIEKDVAIYIISASINLWIIPWGVKLKIDEGKILCTEAEIKNGKLTGKFITPNCFGQEKINRLLAKETDRENYYLYAFGDSRGDKEMLSFADESYYKPFRK